MNHKTNFKIIRDDDEPRPSVYDELERLDEQISWSSLVSQRAKLMKEKMDLVYKDENIDYEEKYVIIECVMKWLSMNQNEIDMEEYALKKGWDQSIPLEDWINEQYLIALEVENRNTKNTGSPRKYRSWCFTLNNYDKKDIKNLEKEFKDEKYVFQEEVGENGTKHLQGVVTFKNQRYMNGLKMIDDRIHWEVCKNVMASRQYCQKKETRKGKVYKNV